MMGCMNWFQTSSLGGKAGNQLAKLQIFPCISNCLCWYFFFLWLDVHMRCPWQPPSGGLVGWGMETCCLSIDKGKIAFPRRALAFSECLPLVFLEHNAHTCSVRCVQLLVMPFSLILTSMYKELQSVCLMQHFMNQYTWYVYLVPVVFLEWRKPCLQLKISCFKTMGYGGEGGTHKNRYQEK